MLHDPEKEHRRRAWWYKVRGLMFLGGLALASVLIVLGVGYLAYWAARGIF